MTIAESDKIEIASEHIKNSYFQVPQGEGGVGAGVPVTPEVSASSKPSEKFVECAPSSSAMAENKNGCRD